MTGQGMGWMLLWLAVILVLIPLSLWVAKRSGMAGVGRGGAAGLRQVASLSLGPQQRVVTVEVGEGEARRWLVLGVTAQSITSLHEMPPGASALEAGRPLPAFSQMLARFQPADTAPNRGDHAR